MYVYTIFYFLLSLSILQDTISPQERHQNMKWFDAGTKQMSVSSFGSFIKLIKVQPTGTWVSPQSRSGSTLGLGPEAARLDHDLRGIKDCSMKAAVLFTKGLHCMHWHASVACSVVLALLWTPWWVTDDADIPICLSLLWTTWHIHKCLSHYQGRDSRPVRTHIGRSRTCAAAGLGIQELGITLQTRQTNTMVGCSCAAGPAPDLWHHWANCRVLPLFVNEMLE